jgi:hypothetical protein
LHFREKEIGGLEGRILTKEARLRTLGIAVSGIRWKLCRGSMRYSAQCVVSFVVRISQNRNGGRFPMNEATVGGSGKVRFFTQCHSSELQSNLRRGNCPTPAWYCLFLRHSSAASLRGVPATIDLRRRDVT